ncbi:MAG: TatD family hydrolase [Micrococcales bacterium]|nr:TatD family hydrolase [Micrococcales bacterium]
MRKLDLAVGVGAADRGTAKLAKDRSYPPLPEPLPAPVVDNHTHIEPGQWPRPALSLDSQVEKASAVGVDRIVQCGCDLDSAYWTATEAVKNPAVLGAIAIHPNEAPRLEAKGAYQDGLNQIRQWAIDNPRVRAIGETGLDFYRTGPEHHHTQIEAFKDHIALAKELGLALQIHDRDAHREVVETLEAVGAPERTVFHCFSAGAELASICAERGWYCSFAGTITFANAKGLVEAVGELPASGVLLETDAPYLTAEPYRGRANAPYLAALTMRRLASAMSMPLEAACAQVSANSEAVYGTW